MEIREIIGKVDKAGNLYAEPAGQLQASICRFAGESVILTVEQMYPRQSSKQRRYYFKCIVEPIRRVFNEFGANMSKLEMHEWLKKNVGKIEKEVIAPDGEVTYTTGSYKKLKKSEAEIYHELCREYGVAKLHLQIELPNESEGL